MNGIYVYDIEQLSNFHSCTFMSVDDKTVHQFVIHELRNDLDEYVAFLKQCKGLIGYNNVKFDYPIIDYIIRRYPFLKKQSASATAARIYDRMLNIMELEFSPFREREFLIPQRDLYLIHHYDNKNKRTSLKHLEVVFQWENVLDMPIDHYDGVWDEEGIDKILEYNLNDVAFTYRLYEESQREIEMRRKLGRKYGLNLMNANEPKIGERIVMKYVAEESNGVIKEPIPRTFIKLRHVISPNIKFETPEFRKVLDSFLHTAASATSLKGSFKEEVVLDGMAYNFGYGGIHAARNNMYWKSTENETIELADVTSYYPFIAIVNGFYPEHLGQAYCHAINRMFNERKEYSKKTPENYGLKIGMNGVYGKSNEEFSPLRDPVYTLKITVNGQLFLAMLCERMTLAGFRVIMANTDGVAVMVPKSRYEEYRDICTQWEEETKLMLEYDRYKVMYIRDVNNYIVAEDNASFYQMDNYILTPEEEIRHISKCIKAIGDYELHSERMNRHWWHKDPSFPIIPYAVMKNLIFGIPLSTTFANHQNMYDFMGYKRIRGGTNAVFYTRKVAGEEIEEEYQQKTIRFLVSKEGGSLVKIFDDGREIRVLSGCKVVMTNYCDKLQHDTISRDRDTLLNFNFYTRECLKLIRPVVKQQTALFE